MMKRWMGVLAVMLWCLGGGVALGEDKGKPVRVKVDAKDVKVNINEATKTELMHLSGVGAGGGLAASGATGGKNVEFPAESSITFKLTEPVTIER